MVAEASELAEALLAEEGAVADLERALASGELGEMKAAVAKGRAAKGVKQAERKAALLADVGAVVHAVEALVTSRHNVVCCAKP